MGIQRGVGHFSRAHGGEHRFEILHGSIAAAHQRHFPLMKLRVGEADLAADDGDQYIGAAVGDELKAALHCLWIAGCIEHPVEEHAVGERRKLRYILRPNGNGSGDG